MGVLVGVGLSKARLFVARELSIILVTRAIARKDCGHRRAQSAVIPDGLVISASHMIGREQVALVRRRIAAPTRGGTGITLLGRNVPQVVVRSEGGSTAENNGGGNDKRRTGDTDRP